MTDIINLMKGITVDIIAITTIWGLLNNPEIPLNYFKNYDNKIYHIDPTYKILVGVGFSMYIMSKYY
jgi:hypothetical protein